MVNFFTGTREQRNSYFRHNMRLIFKLGTVHTLCINERLTYIQWPTLLVWHNQKFTVFYFCVFTPILPCVFVLLSCIMLCNAFRILFLLVFQIHLLVFYLFTGCFGINSYKKPNVFHDSNC